MHRPRNLIQTAIFASLPLLFFARNSLAYVDLAPTLARVVKDSATVSLVEVTAFDRDSHVVTLKMLRPLKGTPTDQSMSHNVSGESHSNRAGAIPRPIVQWASPGAQAVLFASRGTALVCFGTGWYQANRSSSGDVWTLGKDRPDLPLTYYGTVWRMAEAIEQMQAGKSAIITVVAHGADDEAGSFDVALNRQNLPGIVRLQRIRADNDMPDRVVAAAANPAYFIGDGQVDDRDIPTLESRLKNPDDIVRAEAADDLRSLGRKGKTAVNALAALLADPAPRPRFSAAAALLYISPKDTRGISVIAAGLSSPDVVVRRAAVSAAGFAGANGAPLSDQLAALLKDSDEAVRIGALQSISMLGPAAASAVPAVIPLLDNADMAVDAADALGRIGTAATPALPRLAQMLSSDQPPMQLAAVRGMSQIGGQGAHPAVVYISQALRNNPSEADAYNMMIYLALMGPVSQDALPAIQSSGLKNPVLPAATMWAINPTQGLPWNTAFMGMFGMGGGGGGGGRRGGRNGRGGGGPGGPGGGGPGGGFGGPGGPGGGMPGGGGGGIGLGNGGAGDIWTLIYQSYVHELGTRLRPAAPVLASAIIDGTAGDVPQWGYKILSAGPDLSLSILTPHLADNTLDMRERAAVAIGYMGESAAPAKSALESALQKSTNDQEKLLFQWALREINPD